MFKSLRPSVHPDYVLIHKKALLINTFAFARSSTLLSRLLKATDSGFTGDNLAEEIGNAARDKVNELTEEEINALCESILDNLETESGLTIVISGSESEV